MLGKPHVKQITVTQNNYHHPSRYLLDLYISFVKDEPGRGDAAYASSYRTKALLSASVTTEQNKKHLGSLYYPKNKKKKSMNGPACWFLWYYCLWTFLYIAITEIFEHLIKYDLGWIYI